MEGLCTRDVLTGPIWSWTADANCVVSFSKLGSLISRSCKSFSLDISSRHLNLLLKGHYLVKPWEFPLRPAPVSNKWS